MTVFIDRHRAALGVEAICRVLPCAPSRYSHHKPVKAAPDKASSRARPDAILCEKISRHWDASQQRYGAVKIWHDRLSEGVDVARCPVVPLMKTPKIQGITRIKSPRPGSAQRCDALKIKRSTRSMHPRRISSEWPISPMSEQPWGSCMWPA